MRTIKPARKFKVEIPQYFNEWKDGDRYGEVLLVGTVGRESIYKVRLDISGKILVCQTNECGPEI